MKHGGRATIANLPRAHELADELRPLLPAHQAIDEPLLQVFCLCLARIERMVDALEQIDEGIDEPAPTHRLREELRAQMSQARRLASDLGATPASRMVMMRDVADAHRGDALREHLRRNYPSVTVDEH